MKTTRGIFIALSLLPSSITPAAECASPLTVNAAAKLSGAVTLDDKSEIKTGRLSPVFIACSKL
jgi:hypothetical protein